MRARKISIWRMATGIVVCSVFIVSCNNSPKTNYVNQSQVDTTFLKTIKWDSLNTFVDYHILKEGVESKDTTLTFEIKVVTVYQYFNQSYEEQNDDTSFQFSRNQLTEFLGSDRFSDLEDLDCLLRVNSKIGFYFRPDLLRAVFVRPKDMSSKGVQTLLQELKMQTFVQSVSSKTAEPTSIDTFLNNLEETVYIRINLDSSYWSLEKLQSICQQLQMRPDVEEAFFNDLFTGINEHEIFYRLTSLSKDVQN